MEIWPVIHAERKSLADDVRGLSDEQWATPSLCSRWTVRDVLAHMTATAKIAGPAFFPKLLASGFSLAKLQDKDIAVERGTSPADTLERFEAVETSTKHPPGPVDTWLGVGDYCPGLPPGKGYATVNLLAYDIRPGTPAEMYDIKATVRR